MQYGLCLLQLVDGALLEDEVKLIRFQQMAQNMFQLSSVEF